MKFPSIASVTLAGRLFAALPFVTLAIAPSSATPAFAQSGIQTQTVVTVMPKKGDQLPTVTASQIQATVGDKRSQVATWIPLTGERSGLQLMVLIDGAARSGLSLQYKSLDSFVRGLPEGAQVGVAYMQNGQAVVSQNFTADHNLAAQAFHLTSGVPGSNASPYFCLSDLVKRWPGGATTDRREVLMITDGVDLYNGRGFDPNDPYVQAAITDAQRAGIIVHSIFYRDTGRFDNSRWTEAGAQNYLLQVSDGTGGHAYWQGFGNPVTFSPFLDDLATRLKNQYELGLLASPRSKTQLQQLKLKVSAPGVKVDAPQMIVVPGSETASR